MILRSRVASIRSGPEPLLLGSVLVLLAGCGASDPPPAGLIIGFVEEAGSAESRAARAGAELGAAEAAHAAALVDGRVSLAVERADDAAGVAAAVRRLVDRGATAILGGFHPESCNRIAQEVQRRGALFLNLGCSSDPLRRRAPSGTFHIAASDSTYRSAVGAAGDGSSSAAIWHADLERFGAGQLNDRFRAAGVPPSADAWAGWFAVKILWEGYLATGSATADRLESHLLGEAASFDGHKGERLHFDPGTRQLLQPLYLIDSTGAPTGATRSATGAVRSSNVPGPLVGDAYLFVSNEGSFDVSVIDARSNVVVATIPVPARPRGIQASPDGGSLFVALSDDAPLAEGDEDAILAFDLGLAEFTGHFRAGSDPEQFVIDPTGRFLVAANEDAGTATLTDLRSGEALATLVVGIEPEGIAISPDGRWVYVAAETSNTVSVIDMERLAVVASFLVDSRPRGVAFSPVRPAAYVTNEISGTVSVIDTRTHTVRATVELDSLGLAKPVGAVVSPDGRRIYVATGHANSIAVIDAETLRVVAEIPVGRRPWGIALSRDGSRIYTANGGSDDVSVVDAVSLSLLATVPVGQRPWGVALSPGW